MGIASLAGGATVRSTRYASVSRKKSDSVSLCSGLYGEESVYAPIHQEDAMVACDDAYLVVFTCCSSTDAGNSDGY